MEIKPYEKNAKKHPKKQIEQIKASITEFGMNQPIVVDKQGVIIVGHGRYQALKELGMEIMDEWIKTVDLTEEQANAYRLADNKLNESEWDMNLVIEELKGLSEPMLELTGFDSDLIIEPEEKDDEVPEVPEEPQSKLGDLYELGNHRVLCGDSTDESLMRLVCPDNAVDAIITDPPYGIAYEESKNWSKPDYVKRPIIGDDHKFDYRNTAFPQSKAEAIWGANYFADTIPNFYDGNYVVWAKAHTDKENEVFGSAFELCWMYPKHKQVIFFCRRVNMSGEEHGLHVTQKPLDVIRRCIEYLRVPDGGTIYDAFLGSGSTLIASEKTGRICYGMELDPKYVDVIVQRYVDYTGNTKIKRNGEEITWQKTKAEDQQ